MCRMVGVIAASEFSGQSIFSSLRRYAYEHRDGWGVAHKHSHSKSWHIERGLTPAYACSRFQTLQSSLNAHAWVAHLRLASVGGICFENAHPFHRNELVFCHNGTLTKFHQNRCALEREIDEDFRVGVTGSTDSERIFALLLTQYRRTDETLARPTRLAKAAAHTIRIAHALFPDDGDNKTALNLLLSDGETLIATRRGRSLHVGQHKDALLIASDKLIDAEWSELSDDDLVIANRTSGICRYRLGDLMAH